MSIDLTKITINVVKQNVTGTTPVQVIKRENTSSPKNALEVSQMMTGVDALIISLNASSKDYVLAGLPSRTGQGDQHEDNGGQLSTLNDIRKENPGTVGTVIKNFDTTSAVVFSVIKRESSSPKNALEVSVLSSSPNSLVYSVTESDYNNIAASQYMVDPYAPLFDITHMYSDIVGNTISDQKSRGGAV